MVMTSVEMYMLGWFVILMVGIGIILFGCYAYDHIACENGWIEPMEDEPEEDEFIVEGED